MGLSIINWNIGARGPRLIFFSRAAMVIISTIFRGSRLNFNGKVGDVTVLCPPA